MLSNAVKTSCKCYCATMCLLGWFPSLSELILSAYSSGGSCDDGSCCGGGGGGHDGG